VDNNDGVVKILRVRRNDKKNALLADDVFYLAIRDSGFLVVCDNFAVTAGNHLHKELLWIS
jgi:hypothetical protein